MLEIVSSSLTGAFPDAAHVRETCGLRCHGTSGICFSDGCDASPARSFRVRSCFAQKAGTSGGVHRDEARCQPTAKDRGLQSVSASAFGDSAEPCDWPLRGGCSWSWGLWSKARSLLASTRANGFRVLGPRRRRHLQRLPRPRHKQCQPQKAKTRKRRTRIRWFPGR